MSSGSPRQFWMLAFPIPALAGPIAASAERRGWDGILFTDSQNLAPDVYIALAAAAGATTRLGLGTGVTNPVTRHAAVTASAIATVHAMSGGRAVLGIGRGDSALAYIGRKPAPVAKFERYLADVRAYLHGRPVEQHGHAGSVEWLAALGVSPVPVDVAATGPRVIAAGARLADRVTFAVGADPERMRWAVTEARRAREAAGLDPGALSLGAYVNVFVHPDATVARDAIRGGAATIARFAAMPASPTAHLPTPDRDVIARIGARYEMASHAKVGAAHAAAADDDFIDRFAVAGSSQRCIDRLGALFDLGIERIAVIGGSRDVDPTLLREANRRFAEEVIPGLR